MQREKHRPVLLPAVAADVLQDGVGEIPAQVHARRRILDPIGRRREDAGAARAADLVGGCTGARPITADDRHDACLRAGSHQSLHAARDVVNVGGLFQAVDDGARVAAAVARVEHQCHPGEVRALDLVGELRGFQPRVLLLDALRIVGRPELGREVREGDPDRKPHRHRVHVGHAVGCGDLRRLRVDVLRMEPPGEANDDCRVERFALAQPVDRVTALLVLREFELRRFGLGRRGRRRDGLPERRRQQARRHEDDLPHAGLERWDRAPLPDVAIARPVAREPLGDPPEAFRLARRRGDVVLPSRGGRAVRREQGLDRDLAIVAGEQAIGHADELAAPQMPQAPVGCKDRLFRLRIVRQALDERVDALSRQRPRENADLVGARDRHPDLRGNGNDFLAARGTERSRSGKHRCGHRRPAPQPASPRPEAAHPGSRPAPRKPGPPRTPPPPRIEGRGPGRRAAARPASTRTARKSLAARRGTPGP